MDKRSLMRSIVLFSLVGIGLTCLVNAELVGYWWLEGDAVDASGNGNNGTLFGGSSFVTGVFGISWTGNRFERDKSASAY